MLCNEFAFESHDGHSNLRFDGFLRIHQSVHLFQDRASVKLLTALRTDLSRNVFDDEDLALMLTDGYTVMKITSFSRALGARRLFPLSHASDLLSRSSPRRGILCHVPGRHLLQRSHRSTRKPSDRRQPVLRSSFPDQHGAILDNVPPAPSHGSCECPH